MALDKFSNTGLSTLASGIDASQLTATLAAGTGSRFPADTFNIIIWASSDFANPIDAADREIVRCTNRAGDVLTIVRGQEGTTGIAHNTAGKTYSVALIVSQKFRDDIQTRFDNGPAVTPENFLEFYEDFEAIDVAVNPGTGAVRSGKYGWWVLGGAVNQDQKLGGVWTIRGDATSNGTIHLSIGNATVANAFNQSKLPDLRVRWARVGSATSRIGLSTDRLDADPANGIFFRHGTGNINAVCRASGTESTLDTGVGSADGVFHTGRIVIESSTLARVFIDGVEKGTITTNIPTVNLGLGAGSDNNGSAVGLNLDYMYVTQKR